VEGGDRCDGRLTGVILAGMRRGGLRRNRPRCAMRMRERIEVNFVDGLLALGCAVNRALHRVLEFADITGPGPRQHRRYGALAEARKKGPLELGREAHREVMGQLEDVFRPDPQRRDIDHVEGQPVQQIRAEIALSGHGGQVGIGGGDDAHIRLQAFVTPYTLEFTVFYGPQELLLHALGNGGELIKKQAAAIGALEAPGVPAIGPGKGAGFVTEQLRLEQAFASMLRN
jgi:hypothetical protein